MGLAIEIRRKRERKLMREIGDSFFSPLEEITEELMEELVQKGWDDNFLIFARKGRCFYNRKTNEIVGKR